MSRAELYIDTSKVEEIVKWRERLPIEGVTTNQVIMTKDGIDPSQIEDTIRRICRALPGKPVSVELLDSKRSNEELIAEAVHYASLDPNIVVKIPTIAEGRSLALIKQLSEKGIVAHSTINMTAEQMVLAACAGARYVSLFFNRVKDAGEDPCAHIERITNLIAKRNFDTKVIVGSIRQPTDITQAFSSGAHIVTVTPKVLVAALYHPKTEETREEFDEQGRKFLEAQKLPQ